MTLCKQLVISRYSLLLSNHLSLSSEATQSALRHCEAREKSLTIPFCFADTPAERSEFAHPDCTPALSILSYYYSGLTPDKVKQSFQNLLSLGKNTQWQFYSKWFNLSVIKMESEGSDHVESLNCAKKINFSNKIQLNRLQHFYHCNMLVINFYLNTHIFPVKLKQYGKRLTATSWNLAYSPSRNIVGFSGTNGKLDCMVCMGISVFVCFSCTSFTLGFQFFHFQTTIASYHSK